MASRQPEFEPGDGTLSYYLRWVAGGLVVGFLVGLVAGVNPFGTAIAGVGVLMFGNGALLVPEWWRARSIERQSVDSLRGGGGTAEVAGEAQQAGETVTAPYSGEECLAYTVSVEDYEYVSRPRGGGSYEWQGRYWDTERRPFLLDDGTGTAFVDPRDAEFHFPNEYNVTVEAGENPPEAVRRGLRAQNGTFGVGDGSLPVVNESDKRRFKEFRLDVGDEVMVSGQADDPEGDLAGEVETVLSDGPAAPWFTVSTDTQTGADSQLFERVKGAFVVGGVLVLGGGAVAVFV